MITAAAGYAIVLYNKCKKPCKQGLEQLMLVGQEAVQKRRSASRAVAEHGVSTTNNFIYIVIGALEG